MKRSPASSCSSSSSNFVKKPTKTKISKKSNNQTRKQNAKSSKSSSARRSSIYRGVTRHRWTGRFEAHLWDKSSWNNVQNKKGRQVYLGAYDSEEAAAHTYDLAALKYWGPDTTLNFPVDNYTKELEEMQKVTREEYLATLRRRSSGFSRGVSKYRGVARHHHNGRWEARIGRVFGNKYLYLGTYDTQEEAAAAYDLAAIEYRGINAVTNFDIRNYIHQSKDQILPSSTQPQQQEEEQENQKNEQQQEQEQEQEQEASTQLQYSPAQLLTCMDSATMADVNIMEPSEMDDHKLNWSFLETFGLVQLSVPDLLSDKHLELPDFSFDDTAGFEDNIDFMFGETVSSDQNDIKLSVVLDDDVDAPTTDFKVIEEVKASGKVNGNGQQIQLSSSSSQTSSTTTSVSCN